MATFLAPRCTRLVANTLPKRSYRQFLLAKADQNISQVRWQHAVAQERPAEPPEIESEASHPRQTSKKQLKLTADFYGHLKRSPSFKQLHSDDVKFFNDLLGSEGGVVDGFTSDAQQDLAGFNVDWMRKYCGQARLVLKPSSTEQLSQILEYCNNNKLAVTPQGGNTGLVGGSVPVFDEIVINLSRMNKIRSFDSTSGVLVAEAGVLLQDADEHVKSHNSIFPLDLGAKGSCQIGGNVSTNAGGLRLLRYGSLHGNVLGLEVVLPDGTILNDLSQLRKDNTGYDFKQLFVGAEGTIGIVTAISILCPQRSNAVNVAYLGLDSYTKVQHAFREAKNQLSEILSAFELMDAQSQQLYQRASSSRLPLEEGNHPFYCLIETSGSNGEHDSEKLQNFLEYALQEEIVANGVIAQDETQAQSLWACREGISEASQHFGGVYKYDFSIPLPQLYGLIEETRQMFQQNGLMGDSEDYPVVDVVGYGHMGDSNLHMNVATRWYDKAVERALEPFVYEWVARQSGSISAEHGLGLAKKEYVSYSRSETSIKVMKQIKQLFDPNGIMNPYKYI